MEVEFKDVANIEFFKKNIIECNKIIEALKALGYDLLESEGNPAKGTITYNISLK